MTLDYRAATVRGHTTDELAVETAAFLNGLPRDPRDFRVQPFVDPYSAEAGTYCALVIVEIPQ